MNTHSPNIRQIVAMGRTRSARVASIAATMSFEDELKMMLADQRAPRPLWFSRDDAKLFLNSFMTFFICAVIFLN